MEKGRVGRIGGRGGRGGGEEVGERGGWREGRFKDFFD